MDRKTSIDVIATQTSGADRGPQVVSASQLLGGLSYGQAEQALREALERGFDPATDHERSSLPLGNGSMLLMPSESGRFTGIKVLTMAPGNPGRGLDLIQGVYLLFDGETLGLTHVIDGSALTDLRTPAMTMMALLPGLRRFKRPLRVVVYGAGHQGRAHAEALRQIAREHRDGDGLDASGGLSALAVESIVGVVRHPEAVSAGPEFTRLVAQGSAEAAVCLGEADVVMCATPATEPLFDSSLLRDDVVVAAIGSHTPQARELDGKIMRRADVIVEDRSTALRECGDVVLAIGEGKLDETALVPISHVITGRHDVDPTKPYVFKGSGMPWQDLVVASAYAREAEIAVVGQKRSSAH